MAQPLFCDFMIPSEKGPRYWWPIIFEAMSRKSFRFTAPRKPEGQGYYYYVNLQNYSDTDFVESSFRAAWDRIYEGASEVMVTFWPSTNEVEPMSLDISLEEISPGQMMRINLSLEDAYLLEAAKGWKQNLQFVKQLLPDGSSLYLLDRIPVRVRGGWDFLSLLE